MSAKLAQLIQNMTDSDIDRYRDESSRQALRYLTAVLQKPTDPLLHLNIAYSRAEIYTFTDDTIDAASGVIGSNGVEWGMILRSLRLPSPRVWIELRTTTSDGVELILAGVFDNTRHAFNKEAPKSDTILTIAAIMPHQLELPAIIGDFRFAMPIETMKVGDREGFRMGVQRIMSIVLDPERNQARAASDVVDKAANQIVEKFLLALFLIITPRLCEIKHATKDAKLQRARARRGKPPLIEYKTVKLNIGVGRGRYESVARSAGADEDVIRRKLHHVVGHFRTYTKDREQPHIAWVPDHWRGDAKLGIVMHERDVQRAPKAQPLPPKLDDILGG